MEIADIRTLAIRARSIKQEDVPLEPVPALTELYTSIRHPVHPVNDRVKHDNKRTSERKYPSGERITLGIRNDFLNSLAGTMRRRGMGEESIFAALVAENEERCEPPLEKNEVRKIAKGIQRYEPEEPFHPPSKMPAFPLSVLPPTMRRLVEESAASIDCPPDFIAVPMLATLGSAVGNSYVLRIKRGYVQGAAIFSAIVADPGEKKSPAFQAATGPAWKREMKLKREHDEKIKDYLHKKGRWEAEKKKAGAEGQPVPPPPEEPLRERAVVEDPTIEALIERLEENPRGLLLSRDELSGWVRGMDQYRSGKGGDRQFYLSVWSNSSTSVDRKSGRKKSITVPRPFVCVTGTIQPNVLSEMKNGRDDGFMDRFIYCYPDPVSSRDNDFEISDEAVDGYQRLYDRLCDLGMRMDENEEPAPNQLGFTPEAKKVWRKESNSLREEMEHPLFPASLRGSWSKLEAYLARLSLILTLARIMDQENSPPEEHWAVEEQDIKAAAELISYFKAHARRVYAKLYGEKAENLLWEALDQFLDENRGTWEGMTSELYKILENRSTPGLPGGEVPLGKMLRKFDSYGLCKLTEGDRGKQPIIKLSKSTPGTFGEEAGDPGTESTEGKNRDESSTETDANTHWTNSQLVRAMEKLFEAYPEHLKERDPEAISVELYHWGYLDFIPDETKVAEALDNWKGDEEAA
jgi:hypothetical protein